MACLICGLLAPACTMKVYTLRVLCWCVLFSVTSGLMMTFVLSISCHGLLAHASVVSITGSKPVLLSNQCFQTFLRHQQRPFVHDVPGIELLNRRQLRAVDVASRSFQRFIPAIDRNEAASIDSERLVHLSHKFGLGL